MAENDVQIRFGASTEGVNVGITQVRELLQGLTAPLRAVRANLGELAEAFAAAFAVDKVEEFTESMAALGREVEKANLTLGVNPQQFAGMKLAAEDAGTSGNDIERVFARLNANLEKESKRTAQVLGFLGLSFKQLDAEVPIERLNTVGDALLRVQDAGARDAASTALLGRGFAQIALYLEETKNGLSDFSDEAERTGTVIGSQLQAQMAASQSALTEMRASFEGVGIVLYSTFGPAIDAANKIMTDLVENMISSYHTNAAFRASMDDLGFAVKAVVETIAVFSAAIQESLILAVAGVNDLISVFEELGAVVRDVFTAISAGIGQFFSNLLSAAKDAIGAVGQEFLDLGSIISDVFNRDFGAAGEAFGKMKGEFSTVGDDFGKAASSFDFSQATADAKSFYDQRTATAQQGTADIAGIEKQFHDQMHALWSADAINTESGANAKGGAIGGQLPASGGGGGGGKGAGEAAIRDAQATYAKEVEDAKAAAAQITQSLDGLLKTHQITMSEWLSQSLTALDQEQDAIQDAATKELQTAGLTSAQKINIARQEETQLAAIAKQEAADQQKAAQAAIKPWQDAFKQINSAFEAQISGLLKGTTSWATAFHNVIASLTTDLVKFFLDWALKQTETVALQLAGMSAVQAAQATGLATGAAANAASMLGTLGADAAKVFGGIFAFLAPVMGPAASGPATAGAVSVLGAGAGIGSAESGAWEIPNQSLWMLHPGETVLPAGPAQSYRDAMSGIGGGNSGGGGSVTHNWSIQAVDAQSFITMLNNSSSALAKAVQRATTGNPSLSASPY